ncbi:MAG: GerW family sporulation protein, partial [Bacilli bacterium]|nr:GerW family sporulation protein [Bacilli bacterium]
MDNLVESKIKDTIASIFKGVDALADTKKVIGEPYTIGETTIIPFIETSVGLGVGDLKNNKEAAGAGCKVKPIACLIIQDGFTKLINIENQDAITKALDMIPDLVDKLLH